MSQPFLPFALPEIGADAKVFSVRPGITDIASIEFRNESDLLAQAADPEYEYVHVVMPQKLRLATAYVDQASLVTDLRLLCRTIGVLIGARSRP